MRKPPLDPSLFTFSPTAGTVTFAAGPTRPTHQAQIVSIVNASSEVYLYLPVQSGRGGTYNAVTGVLTLEIGTATMSSGNALQIVIDDSEIGATSTLQAAGNAALVSIESRIGTTGTGAPALPSGATGVAGLWQLLRQELLDRIPATGVATAAAQPMFGTAGTPSADVLTVQGAGGGEPVQVTNGVVGQAQYTFSGAILVNTQLMLLDCSNCSAVSMQVGSMGTGGVIAAEWSNNGTTFGSASTASTGSGSQTWGSIVSAGLFVVPRLGKWLQLRMATAASGGTTSLSVVLLADSPMVNAVAQLNGGSTGIVGSVVQGYSAASSFAGATKTSIFSAASTNAAVIKGSAGKVLGFWFTNTTANHVPVRLYNLAGVPNVGTSTTFTRIVVPPSGYVTGGLEGGYLHSVGIAIAITAGLADGDSTAVTAGAIIGELFTI